MLSPEALAVIARKRAEPQSVVWSDPPGDRAIRIAQALADPPPPGTTIVAETFGGVPCERVTAEGAGGGDGLILLLHGGAYIVGCAVTRRKMAEQISARTGLSVLLADYRLAPEDPAPAALEDALAVTRALFAAMPPSRLGVVGDSAGGGLALALFLALKARALPLPACAVLMSPWTDILARGRSYVTQNDDPSMNAERLRAAGRLYVGAGDPLDPLISPIEGDLAGLPPLLIQVGGAERMLDDSTVLAERVAAAGGQADLRIWPGLWHVFQTEAPRVPEAVAAIAEAGAFLRRHRR